MQTLSFTIKISKLYFANYCSVACHSLSPLVCTQALRSSRISVSTGSSSVTLNAARSSKSRTRYVWRASVSLSGPCHVKPFLFSLKTQALQILIFPSLSAIKLRMLSPPASRWLHASVRSLKSARPTWLRRLSSGSSRPLLTALRIGPTLWSHTSPSGPCEL